MDSQWGQVRRSAEALAVRMEAWRLVLVQALKAELTARWHLEMAH